MPVLQCRLGGDFSAQLRGAASSVTGFKDVRIAPSLSTRSLSSSARCSQTFFIAFRPVPLSRLRPLRGCRGDLRGAMNQSNSLVKYDSAVLVVTSKAGKQHAGKKLPPVESKASASPVAGAGSLGPPAAAGARAGARSSAWHAGNALGPRSPRRRSFPLATHAVASSLSCGACVLAPSPRGPPATLHLVACPAPAI